MGKGICVAAACVTVVLLTGNCVTVQAQGDVDVFYIVSSINPAKQQVVVKRPTEVTQVLFVDAATRYMDRGGRTIVLSDLRAGDTVYVREKPGSSGAVAIEIRKGPMTVTELRKRYLQARN